LDRLQIPADDDMSIVKIVVKKRKEQNELDQDIQGKIAVVIAERVPAERPESWDSNGNGKQVAYRNIECIQQEIQVFELRLASDHVVKPMAFSG